MKKKEGLSKKDKKILELIEKIRSTDEEIKRFEWKTSGFEEAIQRYEVDMSEGNDKEYPVNFEKYVIEGKEQLKKLKELKRQKNNLRTMIFNEVSGSYKFKEYEKTYLEWQINEKEDLIQLIWLLDRNPSTNIKISIDSCEVE